MLKLTDDFPDYATPQQLNCLWEGSWSQIIDIEGNYQFIKP